MQQDTDLGMFLGREGELRRLGRAIQKRRSQLVWGPVDAGKTALLRHAIAELSETMRKRCICWSGAATGRDLVSHFVRGLYLAHDPFVQGKVHADGASEATLNCWLGNQSKLRLSGILFAAAERGHYWFFLDQFPPASHSVAKLMKEIMYRSNTPVYLTGLGHSATEVGFAWSLYWTGEYRIRLGPLPEVMARELLEVCIHRFGLNALDLRRFRDEVLRLSGHLPGAIVNMCELASHRRYQCGRQIKGKVIHLDYLMRACPHAMVGT